MAKKTNPENLVVITKRHVKKMMEEVKLIQDMSKNEFKEYNLSPEFLKREATDLIDACIHNVQSMFKREQNGFNKILYREKCFVTNGVVDKIKVNESKKNEETHIEHVIPISTNHHKIFEFMIKSDLNNSELQKEIVKSFLSPVALINRRHINRKNPQKIKDVKINKTPEYPFKRYNDSNIIIYSYRGEKIDNNTWSIEDHWKLVKSKDCFKEIMDEFNILF